MIRHAPLETGSYPARQTKPAVALTAVSATPVQCASGIAISTNTGREHDVYFVLLDLCGAAKGTVTQFAFRKLCRVTEVTWNV